MATPVHALDVRFRQGSGRLEVLWSDGRLGLLGSGKLRGACRCSACESQRRAGRPLVVADTTRLTELHPIGSMGLQLCFSDGHDRGIYPWVYLHELSLMESVP